MPPPAPPLEGEENEEEAEVEPVEEAPPVEEPPAVPDVAEQPPNGAVPVDAPTGFELEEPPTEVEPEDPPRAGPTEPEGPRTVSDELFGPPEEPATPPAQPDPPAPEEPRAQPDPPAPEEPSSRDYPDRWLQCNSGEVRRRKELSAMTDAEWGRFLNALSQLMTNDAVRSIRNPDVSPFEDLAALHTEFVEEAHGGSYFLPWHRLFLFLLESQLREIDPEVTLPYWNWSLERPTNAATSSVWNRLGHSSFSAGEPGCLTDGPWANWWTMHPEVHCLRRGFTSGTGTWPPLESWANIRALINSDASYSRMATTIEALHGSTHVGVGGDMAVLGTAPNDPVFYLHHAYVDYMYYRWQRNGHGSRMRFSGTHPTLNGTNARRIDSLHAFNKQVRDGMGLGCVQYEDSPAMSIFNAQPAQVQGRTSSDRGETNEAAPIIWADQQSGHKSGNDFALVDAEQAAEAEAFMAELAAQA